MTTQPAEIDLLTEAQRRLAHLARENERLRQEAARLRRRVGHGRHERVIMRAFEDARLMLHLRMAGECASRRWLADAGLVTPWRYGWARGLLKYSRLTTCTPVDLAHLDRAIGRLACSRDKLLAMPPREAMQMLRAQAGQWYVHVGTAAFRRAKAGQAKGTGKPGKGSRNR